jgi:hypothetical protein
LVKSRKRTFIYFSFKFKFFWRFCHRLCFNLINHSFFWKKISCYCWPYVQVDFLFLFGVEIDRIRLSVKKSFQISLWSDFITIWRLIKLVCSHSSILNLLLYQNRGKIFLSEQNTLQIGFAIKLESVNQHYNFPKCHLTVLLVLINQLWTTVASTILCICFSCTPGTLQSQLPICNPDFFQIKRYRFHSDWSH